MAHSRIFQVSIRPIEADDYVCPDDFYENSGDFADYICDEVEDDDRKKDIGYLAHDLSDLFTLDKKGEALVYKGKEAMQKFKEDWADAIKDAAGKVTAKNILDWKGRYDVQKACENTHRNIGYRFKIEDWNGDYADTPAELICYVASEMKKGDKLYVGAVIDYHY